MLARRRAADRPLVASHLPRQWQPYEMRSRPRRIALATASGSPAASALRQALCALACLFAWTSTSLAGVTAGGLLCDLLPAGDRSLITDPRPEFSWIVQSETNRARQTAYRIRVAGTRDQLLADTADLWDSGRIDTDQSINIEYDGKRLAGDSQFWWQLRVWDEDGVPSSWTEPQQVFTGRLCDAQCPDSPAVPWRRMGDEWFVENLRPPGFRDIPPMTVQRPDPLSIVADFGRAAFATLLVDGSLGSPEAPQLVILGEKLAADGRVDRSPGGTIAFREVALEAVGGGAFQVASIPRHSYPGAVALPPHVPEVMPFRYAELPVKPAGAQLPKLFQRALFYPFDDMGAEFASSDSVLNAVWELGRYTLKATSFLGIYIDGERERIPYEGDAYIQMLGHYAVDREFAIQRHTHEFLLRNSTWPTEWQMHSVLMAWEDYMASGNSESLTRNYDLLVRKTLLGLAAPDGLISTRNGRQDKAFLTGISLATGELRDLVDWPPPLAAGVVGPHPVPGETDGFVFTDFNAVVNAFHYRALRTMADIARVLGRDGDAQQFDGRAQVVYKAFNEAFLVPDTGVYVDGIGTSHTSLHANLFPLAFGLVPVEHVPSVVAFVKSRGMACSVYAAQYLLEGLFDAGEASHAIRLMTATGERGWANMLRSGSTMTTEAWDLRFKPNMDWNHAWGSAPVNIVARKLAGIRPLAAAYRQVEIRPQPGHLHHFRVRVPTIRGSIVTEWRREVGGYTYDVTIPANTWARVHLPKVDFPAQVLSPQDAIERVVTGADGSQAVYELAGGTYRFRAEKRTNANL